MKHSLLVSFISTLAFSFGLVKAGGSPGPGNRVQVPFLPSFDAMGITSNHIICGKNVYNKREAYAAVSEAISHQTSNKPAVVGCESVKICSHYPKRFHDERMILKTNGPYWAFPILPNGKLFRKSYLPVSNLVVYDKDGEVAGLVSASVGGYVKCLIDDSYVEGPRRLRDKLRNTANYYTGRG